jgi:hypothetical protein
MNREALGSNLVSLNDQAVRDRETQLREKQRKGVEKGRRKERRRILAERYKPFNELAERNVDVIQRANYIIDACGGVLLMPEPTGHRNTREVVSQVGIILGDAPQSELTPNHRKVCVLGMQKEACVEVSYSESINGERYNTFYEFDQVQTHFDFYYVANNYKKLTRLEKHPLIPRYGEYFVRPPKLNNLESNEPFSYREPRIGDKVVFAGTESSFPYREDDDIPRSRHVGLGDFSVSARKFSPFNALMRTIRYAQFVSETESLEDTMDVIERAARNPLLNPALCAKLSERDHMSPERIATTTTELFAVD